jgi:flagellin
MPLTIGPNTPSTGLTRARETVTKTLNQLSSGQRITRAADDAAAAAISEKLGAAERAFAQGQRNLSDGISLARTAEGSLSQVSDLVSRMRELTVQAGNGALGDEARSAIQSEFDQLAEEVTRITEATEFNGRKLLNGDTSGAEAVTLRDGTGGNDVVQISIQDHSAQALSVEGRDVSDPSTLDALDDALSTISSTRAELGSAENRLEAGIRNLETARENTAAANSRIRDADFAQVAAELAAGQILEQASVATAVQSNIAAFTALELLR